MLLSPSHGATGSRQHQHLYHICIHTFNTTLTLTEIKKRHNLHCRRVDPSHEPEDTELCTRNVCFL